MKAGPYERRGACSWIVTLVVAVGCEAAEPAAVGTGGAMEEVVGQSGTTGRASSGAPAEPAAGGTAAFDGRAGTDGRAAPGGGPGDALAAVAQVSFRWSDEQPSDGGVLVFEATSGADGLVRLRLSYDLGAVCEQHGPHLLPRLSLEPGTSDTRTVRWRMAHPELAVGTELHLRAALRYPAAGPEVEVLRRFVGHGPLSAGAEP